MVTGGIFHLPILSFHGTPLIRVEQVSVIVVDSGSATFGSQVIYYIMCMRCIGHHQEKLLSGLASKAYDNYNVLRFKECMGEPRPQRHVRWSTCDGAWQRFRPITQEVRLLCRSELTPSIQMYLRVAQTRSFFATHLFQRSQRNGSSTRHTCHKQGDK